MKSCLVLIVDGVDRQPTHPALTVDQMSVTKYTTPPSKHQWAVSFRKPMKIHSTCMIRHVRSVHDGTPSVIVPECTSGHHVDKILMVTCAWFLFIRQQSQTTVQQHH